MPTIPALARARHYLDQRRAHDVTLTITGGLRMPPDFAGYSAARSVVDL